ncbi:MAG: CDP-diacylglycerol--serine O-phosphatidyltransferase [Melioribacteraceae bacterium]|nr:CDP-diacylglycerol--serine O-phosphatidyltransferase [Melioribacteraceae bacterium]MCF8265192.1 CDP-diacylglycerol--serine O-phosphatidyltransferase [Melioribacteraceae bacterium]MCF8413763.1 CDP-diacylglycerol--serine O-phosphatidyltransferase [Melioribacteraceae bacterium]
MKNKLPKINKAIYPNVLTAMNALCGFLSIIYASEGEYDFAVYLIFAAVFFDLIDGLSARLFGTSSLFGVQLDSLSDIISFGAAPSFLLYKVYFNQFEYWGMFAASILLISGAFRLARFNISVEEIDKKDDFSGLPIPFSAITVCVFLLTYNHDGVSSPYSYFILPMVILFGGLMVSNIKFSALSKINLTFMKENLILVLLFLLSLVSIFFTDGKSIFYILVGIIFYQIFQHFYLILFSSKKTA